MNFDDKDALQRRYVEKLQDFRYGAKDPRNHGETIAEFSKSLRDGSTKQADQALEPIMKELVLVVK